MVHDGTEYEEVYPSGHKDQESPGEERSPSASSSSSINEDMEMVEVEESSDYGEDLVNQISPNAWRVIIAMEILYGAMTDGA